MSPRVRDHGPLDEAVLAHIERGQAPHVAVAPAVVAAAKAVAPDLTNAHWRIASLIDRRLQTLRRKHVIAPARRSPTGWRLLRDEP